MQKKATSRAAMIIGSNIKRLRKKHGLLQSDIAEILGVTSGTVSRIERGLTAIANEHIDKLCNTFKVSYKFYFDEREIKEDQVFSNTNDNLSSVLKKLDTEIALDTDNKEQIIKEMITFYNYLLYKYGFNR